MIDITKMEMHTMRLSDLEEIKDKLQTDFDDFWSYEIFKEEIVNNNSSYLLLRYNEEIVAFGGFKKIVDTADIMNIVTKKDKRNNGFAKFILNELINIAKEDGLNFITLEVNENNLAAIHLYELFDFKQVGLRKNYYGGTDSAILMTLSL